MKMNRTEIREILFNLRNISAECDGLYLEEIEQLETMFEEEKYKVVVIGEFSTGKSTFLNALIGRETLFSSLREATGVVTYVEKGHEPMAHVVYKDQESKSFPLHDEKDFKELKKYIDRKSKEARPSYVRITTPSLNVDEEVIFIDTPGLQGIGGTELLITKEAIKEANATILLTTEKGFSGSELEVISGRNTKFGKIRTRDIFVVINQIGKVYEGKNKEDSDEKVQSIINEVKGGLEKEGLSTIPVFAVDSRDYLWSKDNHLYQNIKKNTENTTTVIQHQDYYLQRSRFEEFKEHLIHFLSKDQRSQNFISDITEKISYLIEAFEEIFSEQERQDDIQKNKQLDILKHQQNLILDNRKKLYNNLIRAISQSIDTYKEKVEDDLKKSLAVEQKRVVPVIDHHFPSIESLNDKNMAAVNQKVSEVLSVQRDEIERQLSDYYHTLSHYLIDKTWTESFQKIFKQQTHIQMKLKKTKVNIDLEWKDVQYEEEEKAIRDLKREQHAIEARVIQLEKEKDQIKENLFILNETNLQAKKDALEGNYQAEKNKLGKRPEPKQKYKEVKRTKKKFLIFKETYYEKVPDGLDYSDGKKWDREQDKVKTRFLGEMNKLEDAIHELQENKRNFNKIVREIDYQHAAINSIEEDIANYDRFIERKKQQDERFFLNERKMEIVKKFRGVLKVQYDHLRKQVWDSLYTLERNMKEELKQEIQQAIDIFEQELQEKIQDISTKILKSTNHIDYIMNALTKIKGEMTDEF